ncbi:unnamed protein product [Ranitomeya imitator]|uniref:ribonuclease H n=1 Tax=Ranitomeya imitator TaxID=111125 RepID=A0ABN9LCT7_9NEOB|nr:unnamed protein product [Ranitomeya imitator]
MDVQSLASSLNNLAAKGQDEAEIYCQKFRKWSVLTQWNECALAAKFRDGLSEAIKDVMVGFPAPTGLNESMTMAIQIDRRLRERKPVHHLAVSSEQAPETMQCDRIQSRTISVDAYVDSGAALSLMDWSFANRCGFSLEPLEVPIPLKGIDSTPLAMNKPQYWTHVTMRMTPVHQESFMHDIFREYLDKFMIVYLDDVLVFSDDWESHVQQVRKVFQVLRANSLFVKGSKCLFGVQKISFLGYIFSPSTIEMDPVKVQAICDWTQPTSLKSLQKFLGFANFYRRFITNFSSVVKPLTDLTKKGADVADWSPAAVEAFQELKRQFSSAPVLRQPDVSLPFQVEVDASEIGAGAVLSQRSSDCSVMKPCAFFSRKFSPTERNYDVGNRELLAMKWAFEEWHHWLEGARHRVVVLNDHKNLIYLESAKRLNPRQARWSLFFSRFDFVVSYLPGSKNVKADALSRSFVPNSPGNSEPTGILRDGVILSAVFPDLRRALQEFQADKPDRCPPERLFVPDNWTSRVISEVEPSDCPGVDMVVDRLHQIWSHVVDNLKLSQERAQQFANRRRRVGPRLRVGDLVWLSSRFVPMKVSSPKFKPRFIGPYRILEILNPVSFRLDLPASFAIHNVFHRSLLRKYEVSQRRSHRGEVWDEPPVISHDSQEGFNLLLGNWFWPRVLVDVGHIEAQTVRTLWRPVELHEWKTSDRLFLSMLFRVLLNLSTRPSDWGWYTEVLNWEIFRALHNSLITLLMKVQTDPPTDLKMKDPVNYKYKLGWIPPVVAYPTIKLTYQLCFWMQGDEECSDLLLVNVSGNVPEYYISSSKLSSSTNYTAKVRAKLENGSGFNGPWSDWSQSCSWKTDKAVDSVAIIVSMFFTSVGLFISAYLFFIYFKRLKQQWENSIPDPRKSKLGKSPLRYQDPHFPQFRSSDFCAEVERPLVTLQISRVGANQFAQTSPAATLVIAGHSRGAMSTAPYLMASLALLLISRPGLKPQSYDGVSQSKVELWMLSVTVSCSGASSYFNARKQRMAGTSCAAHKQSTAARILTGTVHLRERPIESPQSKCRVVEELVVEMPSESSISPLGSYSLAPPMIEKVQDLHDSCKLPETEGTTLAPPMIEKVQDLQDSCKLPETEGTTLAPPMIEKVQDLHDSCKLPDTEGTTLAPPLIEKVQDLQDSCKLPETEGTMLAPPMIKKVQDLQDSCKLPETEGTTDLIGAPISQPSVNLSRMGHNSSYFIFTHAQPMSDFIAKESESSDNSTLPKCQSERFSLPKEFIPSCQTLSPGIEMSYVLNMETQPPLQTPPKVNSYEHESKKSGYFTIPPPADVQVSQEGPLMIINPDGTGPLVLKQVGDYCFFPGVRGSQESLEKKVAPANAKMPPQVSKDSALPAVQAFKMMQGDYLALPQS